MFASGYIASLDTKLDPIYCMWTYYYAIYIILSTIDCILDIVHHFVFMQMRITYSKAQG